MWPLSVHERRLIRRYLGRLCGICGTLPAGNLAIDHDHETGKVRGRLCMACNTGIGFLKNADNLRKAIEYLANPPLDRYLRSRGKVPRRRKTMALAAEHGEVAEGR